MGNKRISQMLLASAACAVLCTGQAIPQDLPLSDQIERMSDAEQVTLAKSLLDRGLPVGKAGDTMYTFAVVRSWLILPLIEQKIEDVLRSDNPLDCFVDKSVDPRRVVEHLWATLAEAGNRQAMLESRKLLKIDEKRFDQIVYRILVSGQARGNPFKVAYA